MWGKKLLGSLLLVLASLWMSTPVIAQEDISGQQEQSGESFFDETSDGEISVEELTNGNLDSSFFVGSNYSRARVIEVDISEIELPDGTTNQVYEARVVFLGGDREGQEVDVDFGGSTLFQGGYVPREGNVVIISEVAGLDGQPVFGMVDVFRLDGMVLSILVFFAVVVLIAKKRGIGATAGLALSILSIAFILIPAIEAGYSPLLVTFFTITLLSSVTMYLSHGFNMRTTLALLGIIGSVLVSYLVAVIFTSLSKVYGLGSEESVTLQFAGATDINMFQLFLSGVLIGMVGVLDDVTISQAQTLFELKFAKPSMTFQKLYQVGMRIGREHIASLVNTLALAYIGTSLPFFILFAFSNSGRPLWIVLNSEYFAEEIVRTLSGSLAIVLAVPVTNIIIAWYLARRKVTQKDMEKLAAGGHVHSHGHNHIHDHDHDDHGEDTHESFEREKRK